MEDFIRRIPKAEVHVHLEGTMTPETLLRIAAKNNVDVGMSLEELYQRRAVPKKSKLFLSRAVCP